MKEEMTCFNSDRKYIHSNAVRLDKLQMMLALMSLFCLVTSELLRICHQDSIGLSSRHRCRLCSCVCRNTYSQLRLY
jgi:hypothetical protein